MCRKVWGLLCHLPWGAGSPCNSVARSKAYLRTKCYPDPSIRLATIHQRECHDVQLSTWSSAAVLARLLPTSLWCRVTAPSPICCSTTAERTAPEAEYICPEGFLCGWSVGVELVARLPERPGSQQRHFLQAPKDVVVCSVLIYLQRIRCFTTMRYINLRFTYLLLLTAQTDRTTVR